MNSIALTHDGKLISASNDTTLKVWNPTTGENSQTLKGHANLVNAVTVSADCKYAISGSSDNTIKIWELVTSQCVQTISHHTSGVTQLVMSPDGQHLVSADSTRHVCVWRWSDIVQVFPEMCYLL